MTVGKRSFKEFDVEGLAGATAIVANAMSSNQTIRAQGKNYDERFVIVVYNASDSEWTGSVCFVARQLSLGQKLYIIDDAGVDDWNDLVSTGVFSVYAAKNSPIDNGRALWMSALVVRVNGNEQFVTQLAMVPARGAYLRTRHTGEWSSWSEL